MVEQSAAQRRVEVRQIARIALFGPYLKNGMTKRDGGGGAGGRGDHPGLPTGAPPTGTHDADIFGGDAVTVHRLW